MQIRREGRGRRSGAVRGGAMAGEARTSPELDESVTPATVGHEKGTRSKRSSRRTRWRVRRELRWHDGELELELAAR